MVFNVIFKMIIKNTGIIVIGLKKDIKRKKALFQFLTFFTKNSPNFSISNQN